MKKLLVLLSIVAFAGTAYSAELSMHCSFVDDNGGVDQVIEAQSTQYDFKEAFESNFMPTSTFFAGATPELFVVNGKASSDEGNEDMDFFVTKDLELKAYSARAVALLGKFVGDVKNIKTVQLAFSTNLYHSFVYANVKLVNGKTAKISVAGLSIGHCK